MNFRKEPEFYRVEENWYDDGDHLYKTAVGEDPIEIAGTERPALDPMIMARHARDHEEEGEDIEYYVSEDACNVFVVRGEEPEKDDFRWRLGYSTRLNPETNETVIGMAFRPKNEPSENPGSKPWKNIIWTLQDRTEKYYNQVEENR